MAFAHSHDIQVFGSNFTDVGGDMNVYRSQGDIVFNKAELGLQQLIKVACPGAAYDSHDRCPPPRCHPGTRRSVLDGIQRWVEEDRRVGTRRVLWLHGPAGAGKSAVAQTACETLAKKGLLAASFFFARGVHDRNTISTIFPTIAFQLAMSTPDRRRKINDAITNGSYITKSTAPSQFNNLIISTLRSEQRTGSNTPFVVVIDGLDECAGNIIPGHERAHGQQRRTGTNEQLEILSYIARFCGFHHLPLSFLIVSRPEPHITREFNSEKMRRIQSEPISLYGTHQASEDISTYLRSGFNDIRISNKHAEIMHSVPKPWPRHEILRSLVSKSGGYFIYAATVLKYVDEEYFSPVERLNEVLNMSTSDCTPFAELDKLYTHILSTCPKPDALKVILEYIVGLLHARDGLRFANIPLMEAVLQLRSSDLTIAIHRLHSLFRIGNNDPPPSKIFDFGEKSYPILPGKVVDYANILEHWNHEQLSMVGIHILHASFPEYLFDEQRAGKFYIDPDECHDNIFLACLELFANWQKKNTAGISSTTRLQILTNCIYHFREIDEKCMILLYLHRQTADQWPAFISASMDWRPVDQFAIVSMLSQLLEELKNTTEAVPRGLIEQVTSILDAACRTYLTVTNDHDVLFIRGLNTLYDLKHYMSCDEWEKYFINPASVGRLHIAPDDPGDPFELTRRTESLAHLFGLLSSFHPQRWTKICVFLALSRDIIKPFMKDQKRSGALFELEVDRHAGLAACCLVVLSDNCLLYSDSPEYQYALRRWSEHLQIAPPGEKRVLLCLRHSGLKMFGDIYDDCDLDPGEIRPTGNIIRNTGTVKSGNIVVNWLKRQTWNVQEDLLELWERNLKIGRWYEEVPRLEPRTPRDPSSYFNQPLRERKLLGYKVW